MNCAMKFSVCVPLQRAKEMREALNLTIQYMETARADLKQYIRNVTHAMFEDEICYRIQEVVNLLDVVVEEAWEIYALQQDRRLNRWWCM
jgi:hypothetical protein